MSYNPNLPAGQATMPASAPVVIASDQSAIPATQSGTWTFQPGNTANTTPWLVKLNDSTNSFTIKAASTAAVAGDTAVVIAFHPSTQLPPGTNSIGYIYQSTSASSQAATTVTSFATLTVANVKASAGNVYGIAVYNPNASIIYIQFYNTAGTPTLGTSVIWFLAIPASGTVLIPPAALALYYGSAGIGIGASTTPTGVGTPGTAPAVTVFSR